MTDRLLLTLHGVAAALGCRRSFAADLVRRGILRSVPWPGRAVRVPLDEVRRLASVGLTPTGQRARPPRVKPPAASVADAIRRLPVPGDEGPP